MINTVKCLYCGLVLSEPCKTADAAEDCSRKPCEPEELESLLHMTRPPEWVPVTFNNWQRYRK